MRRKPFQYSNFVIPVLFMCVYALLFLLWRATNRRFDALIAFLDIRLQRER